MKIMTFNLRFENSSDGPNAWKYRRELVTELIKKYAPSVLGTQEGMCSQLDYIRDNLPGYILHAPLRTLDATCQYPTLFIFKDDFKLHEGGEFWLSKTPDVHRSKSWDSAFPRMISYARVSDVDTDRVFWIAVTHLDHMGTEARYQQAKIIAEWVQTRTDPVILMGDFNDSPESATHEILTSSETGLLDTWQVLRSAEDVHSFTHHGFTGRPQKTRMDWILTGSHFVVERAEIVRKHIEHRYPSDHFPYIAALKPKG